MPQARVNRRRPSHTVTAQDLTGYLNTVSSSTKKGSYYNLPAEHVAALNDSIAKMMDICRPFASLMCLSPSITDDARIASVIQLIRNRTSDNVSRWECAVFLDMTRKMPPTRVFDMFHYLIGYRRTSGGLRRTDRAIGGRFLKGLIHRWLVDNYSKLELWSVKYRKDFQIVARHMHLSKDFFNGVDWVFGGEPVLPLQHKAETCRKAQPGQVPKELWELPYENARGFALNKCGLSSETFEKEYSERGKKTRKEQRISAKRTAKAGGTVEFDPNKARNVFDLLIYLGGQDTIPPAAREWIKMAAGRQARGMNLSFEELGVVVDTSVSMEGPRSTHRHPLFKALAAARVLEQSTAGEFHLVYTTDQGQNPIIPKLNGATNYVKAVHTLLSKGHKNIIIFGDGYENSFEGMLDEYLKMAKSLVPDMHVVHMNPVGASESGEGVREMSVFAPAAGLTRVEALPNAMMAILTKSDPMAAIGQYLAQLVKLQGPAAQRLMPTEYRALLPAPSGE